MLQFAQDRHCTPRDGNIFTGIYLFNWKGVGYLGHWIGHMAGYPSPPDMGPGYPIPFLDIRPGYHTPLPDIRLGYPVLPPCY